MTATAAPDVDTGDVKARALKGMVVLVARTMASQGLRVVSALALSRLLFPSDYGLFGIVAYAASLGVFLGDLGLSAALVRQPHEPTRDETFTIFWCHQALTAVIVAVVCALAPQLTEGYALGEGAVPMVWAMALGLFLSSLRVIPLMALERRLAFPAIARAELAENVAQVASTLAMAAAGLGAWALALGALVRGVVGLVCIAWASPWRPRGTFRMDVLRRLLGFGLAFQLPPLVAAVVAGWVPLVVGKVLGKDAVGLVNWAWALASTPMMLSVVLNRVAFPAYCRLQDDPEGFAEYLRTSLRRLAAVLLLTLPVAVLGMPVLVPLFFGQRWAAAVPLVQWFSLECLLIVLTGLLATAQNAGGRPWERLAVVVGVGAVKWSIGTWAIHRFGLASVGPVGLVVSLVEVWVTAWRVSRLNPALRGLVLQVVEPLVTVGLLVSAAFLVVHLWIRDGGLSGWAVGTAVFLVLVLVRELLPGTLSLLGELRDILAFVRARRAARVVPASPVS
ncbi:oligosaccharide flippase family protein [Myxococcus qinghaiensis]|uniref:oligosaccharide flippase family protein n=1 Tax=Myxococcus qinghaiensis TaxID=2906758 RepID=UPI0020A721B7|nr:oligosaccharide flippase family protein [Myxococcus qinghaiensis]MCP3164876.1 oligosaccharide flippase family protein [Myxococcus qinghaiensis]